MDEQTPQVSIVIPAYNQAKYLAEAIESACSQTYRDFEIIIVDDGSTDNTREVVDGFGDQVRYIYQENMGLAGARNTGIRVANGNLIGLLDADDQWLPNFLERMVAVADENQDAAVFYCCAQSMDDNGNELPQVFGGPALSSEQLYDVLLRANFIIPSSVLMRRRAVIEVDLFDQSLRSCEDWDLWLRILHNYEIIGISDCLVKYRLHSESLSADPTGMQQATRSVIEKHFGKEDGDPITWSEDKRRAYGGVYRYHTLTSAQRQGNWNAAGVYLRRAIEIDPALSIDLDLFYELAHTDQPPGYLGTSIQLDIDRISEHINSMLEEVYPSSGTLEISGLYNRTMGTANFALGLIGYHIGEHSLCRKYLFKALNYSPELLRNGRIEKILIKSFFTPSFLNKVKYYKSIIPNGKNVST